VYSDRQKTKIIATLGDPDETYADGIWDINRKKLDHPTLQEIVNVFFESDVDVIRINLAHIRQQDLKPRLRCIKDAILRAESKYGRKIGVLADLPGPKIRFSSNESWLLPTEKLYVAFDEREEELVSAPKGAYVPPPPPREATACILLDEESFFKAEPNETKAIVEAAHEMVKRWKSDQSGEGVLAFVGDNDATLQVVAAKACMLTCKVIAAQREDRIVAGRQGFTIRGIPKRISTFTKQDKDRLSTLLEVDFAGYPDTQRVFSHVGISFCQTREDARRVLYHVCEWIGKRKGGDLADRLQEAPLLIAKIETKDGVENLSDILDFADGAMVARGDLALDLKTSELPRKSKDIIVQCNLRGKPVIMATEMLESMIANIECSRPDASDVFNAVVDGADALLLSRETSCGRYPAQAIRKMREIAVQAEDYLEGLESEDAHIQACFNKLDELEKGVEGWRQHYRAVASQYTKLFFNGEISELERQFVEKLCRIKDERLGKQDSTDRVSNAACVMAADEAVRAIVAPTTSGRTARMLARFRPRVWIHAQPHGEYVGRKLATDWGVMVGQIIPVKTGGDDPSSLITASRNAIGQEERLIGETVIFTCGTPLGQIGTTNLIQRWDPA